MTAEFNDSESQAFQAFLEQYARERPWTIPICRASYAAYEREKRSVLRDKILGLNQSEPEHPWSSTKFAGTAFDMSVTALDEANNVATGYSGTLPLPVRRKQLAVMRWIGALFGTHSVVPCELKSLSCDEQLQVENPH